MTKSPWGTYLRALAGSQSEVAHIAGVSQSTVSRWYADGTVPKAETVIIVARAYQMSPIGALVAAGYLEQDEANAAGAQPHILALGDFTELELAQELVRRIEDSGATALERPIELRRASDGGVAVVGRSVDTLINDEPTVLSPEDLAKRGRLDLAARRTRKIVVDQEFPDDDDASPTDG